MNFSQIALFADDIAMYFSNADAVLVQANIDSDLALLSHWAADNGFRINVSKCQSIAIYAWFWLEGIEGARWPQLDSCSMMNHSHFRSV